MACYNEHMFILGLLQWWYGDGWARQVAGARNRVVGVYDYFSIDLLAKSWLAPFRQISAGKVNGSLAIQWNAFVDRTISRFVGAFMRTILIVIGLTSIILFSIYGAISVFAWGLLPFAPLIGLCLSMIGWIPWKM